MYSQATGVKSASMFQMKLSRWETREYNLDDWRAPHHEHPHWTMARTAPAKRRTTKKRKRNAPVLQQMPIMGRCVRSVLTTHDWHLPMRSRTAGKSSSSVKSMVSSPRSPGEGELGEGGGGEAGEGRGVGGDGFDVVRPI